MVLFSFPAQVNERAARLVAAGVAVSLAAAIALHTSWLVPVVAGGFLLRVGWGPAVSPLARAAVWLAARLGPPRPVFGRPKRFAQGIGAAFTLAASALLLAGHPVAGWALAGVVVVCAFLEAAFAFCLGCLAYRWLQAAGLLPPDACVDCARPSAAAPR